MLIVKYLVFKIGHIYYQNNFCIIVHFLSVSFRLGCWNLCYIRNVTAAWLLLFVDILFFHMVHNDWASCFACILL